MSQPFWGQHDELRKFFSREVLCCTEKCFEFVSNVKYQFLGGVTPTQHRPAAQRVVEVMRFGWLLSYLFMQIQQSWWVLYVKAQGCVFEILMECYCLRCMHTASVLHPLAESLNPNTITIVASHLVYIPIVKIPLVS